MGHGISRRSFLKTAGAGAAGVTVSRSLPALTEIEKGHEAILPPLTTFYYGDVQLHDSAMKRRFEENHARFLNLNEDRLLKVFRQVAGLPLA